MWPLEKIVIGPPSLLRSTATRILRLLLRFFPWLGPTDTLHAGANYTFLQPLPATPGFYWLL
jgi:hypothetical protein